MRGFFGCSRSRAHLYNAVMRRMIPILFVTCFLATASGAAGAKGDPEQGRKLALEHCSRCHVIGDNDKFGGIGSTPSFRLLVGMPDWRERFQTFFERRPHPVHVRVEGVAKWTDLPSNAAEFTIKLSDVDDILAFVETLRNRP